MKEREEHIAFTMNYCQHYTVKRGLDIQCSAGMKVMEVRLPNDQQDPRGCNLQPCISGHLLPDPKAVCQHWIRKTREEGEARADAIEESLRRMTVIGPIVSAWRKKLPRGKVEVIECPVCKGHLHLSQARSNGHVHGHCETKGCVSWME